MSDTGHTKQGLSTANESPGRGLATKPGDQRCEQTWNIPLTREGGQCLVWIKSQQSPSLRDNVLAWLIRRWRTCLKGQLSAPVCTHLPGKSCDLTTTVPPAHTAHMYTTGLSPKPGPDLADSTIPLWLPAELCPPSPSLICGPAGPPFPLLLD